MKEMRAGKYELYSKTAEPREEEAHWESDNR